MSESLKLTAYILAKNEEPNIAKCLRSLEPCGIPVVVLDSGSTDRTREIAAKFTFCEVRHYDYVDHATAYNSLTSQTESSAACMILDADMEISQTLWRELSSHLERDYWEVIKAPILMYMAGKPLSRGSLCPPKAFVFRGGREYFVPRGHGEELRSNIRIQELRNRIVHNDLKPYSEYLLSQIRYGKNLARRIRTGQASLKDRLRANSPIMAFVYPIVSLLIYGGVLCGRLGMLYALDRTIAVLVQWRVVLAERLHQEEEEHKSQ